MLFALLAIAWTGMSKTVVSFLSALNQRYGGFVKILLHLLPCHSHSCHSWDGRASAAIRSIPKHSQSPPFNSLRNSVQDEDDGELRCQDPRERSTVRSFREESIILGMLGGEGHLVELTQGCSRGMPTCSTTTSPAQGGSQEQQPICRYASFFMCFFHAFFTDKLS